jgi:hypothetical protein
LLLVAAVVYGRFVKQRRLVPSPPPAASSSVVVPPAAPSATRPVARPAPAPGAEGLPMSVLHERARAWEKEHGRERVWSVVVHLSGSEPPERFEARLREAVSGEVAATRTGGLLHASLAPVGDGERLRAALEDLFPGATVQMAANSRRATVFARPAASR